MLGTRTLDATHTQECRSAAVGGTVGRSSKHALRAASEQTALKDCTKQDPDVYNLINITRRMQVLPIEDENREGIGYL